MAPKRKMATNKATKLFLGSSSIPPEEELVDWTKTQYLSPIRMQMGPTCAIVVATEVVESKYMIEKKVKSIRLAEQEIIDNIFHYYTPEEGNEEEIYCSISKALRYIRDHGISRSEDWPFTGIRADLKEAKPKPKPETAVFITGFNKIRGEPKDYEKCVLEALKKQPLAASMYVNDEFFELKKGVIFSGCKGDERRCQHAVLIVGSGIDSKTKKKYYKIQNSWGEDWADGGYARVERHVLFRISYPDGIK